MPDVAEPTPSKLPPAKAPITDSPWFWLFLFGVFGLAALAAIGPKYVRRQALIERQFYAREEIVRRQSQSAEDRAASTAQPAEAPPGELLIPLRPLALLLSGVLLVLFIIWALRRQSQTPHAGGA